MSTKTETSVILPEPTPEELELLEVNLQLAKAQLKAVGKQQRFQDLQYELAEMDYQRIKQEEQIRAEIMTPEQQEELMRAQFQREIRAGEIYDELSEIELERARLGGAASEEQKQLIAEATEAALELGTSDIRRATGANLELLREELSPSLGLRPGDTPIQIRGQRLAEEGLRQEAQLARGLRAGQAQAELNLPLAATQVSGALSQSQQQISRATSEYQAALRASAAANRMRFAGQGGLGLALSQAAPTAYQLSMARSLASPTTTTELGTLGKVRGWSTYTHDPGGFLSG